MYIMYTMSCTCMHGYTFWSTLCNSAAVLMYSDCYVLCCSYVCCFLQLKEKNSRIEELDGEVLSLKGQLNNAASTPNVHVSGCIHVPINMFVQYMFGKLN